MDCEALKLTTQKNGKQIEWITIIEDGIPLWVAKSSLKKQQTLNKLNELFSKAISEGDEEPVAVIYCCNGKKYELNYFSQASLYLCEELEGRYATLSTILDALWPEISGQDIEKILLM